ncbi:MAG: ABC transporter permease [Rhodospirillaceae bacterium]|nr:ABC transporter permease [Rhodospirillaceae bacterium]
MPWRGARQWAANVFWLGIKELRSLRADPILLVLIVYTFTYAIYAVSTGAKTEVENASVAVVDEDRSPLSRRILGAIQKPFFRAPVEIGADAIDAAMDAGRYVFVLHIPFRFEADVLAGRKPALQLNVDATAMTQAGNGAAYLQNIIADEIRSYIGRRDGAAATPIRVVVRAKFNPNLQSHWFTSVMQIINNITILSVILVGAALIREREHGTVEHLLVMPVTPAELMAAKVWANGLVILVAAVLSLWLVVGWLLAVPVAGSIALFIAGAALYQISVTALGILLATFAGSMPQFGMLVMPVLIIMNLLSGSTTPMESMPVWLQYVMQASPSTQFVAFSQSVLYRGAGFEIVWPELVALAAIGAIFFLIALGRFRKAIASFQ